MWQWCVLPLIGVLAFLIGGLLARLSRRLLAGITKRTAITWDDRLLTLIHGPLLWFWAITVARILVADIGFPEHAAAWLQRGLRTATLVVVFWIGFQMVGVFGRTAETALWATSRPTMRALVPLAVRIGRVAVVGIALVAVLADLNYPVGSLLAGLGIGGLALALAGQKTVENLFGAFSIGFDQPFSVGDTITVDGTNGTVEAIGLRSTRIRSADRTVITIPNGKLAEMKVECFAPRDRIRFACTIGLAYSTSAAQIRKIVTEIEAALRAQPKTHQDDVVVRLKAFTQDALEIEVGTQFLTTDYAEFGRIRQDLLLAFMDIVEQAGTSFAFPTRTIQFVDSDKRPEMPAPRPS